MEITPTSGTGSTTINVTASANTSSTEIVEEYNMTAGGGYFNQQLTFTQQSGNTWILDQNNDCNPILTFEYFQAEPETYSMRVIINIDLDYDKTIAFMRLCRNGDVYVLPNQTQTQEFLTNQNIANLDTDIFSFGIGYDCTRTTSEQINISPNSRIACHLDNFCEMFFADITVIRKYRAMYVYLGTTLSGSFNGDKQAFLDSLASQIIVLIDQKPYMDGSKSFEFALMDNKEVLTSTDLQDLRMKIVNNTSGHHNQNIMLSGFGFTNPSIKTFLPVGDTN